MQIVESLYFFVLSVFLKNAAKPLVFFAVIVYNYSMATPHKCKNPHYTVGAK